VDCKRFGLVLLELAQVQDARGDDLPGVEGRDTGDGEEYPATAENLDHQPDHPRPLSVGAYGDNDVAKLAHRVARGVENTLPDDPGQEDATVC
jgi:hypothetical protein